MVFMTSLQHFPLGATCPDSPHAVISCLPTMADVRGYEENEPRVLAALQSGYPRFVVHAFIRELVAYYLRREGLGERAAVLIPGRRATQDLMDRVGPGVICLRVEGGGGTVFNAAEFGQARAEATTPLVSTEVTRGEIYLLHWAVADRQISHRVRKFVQHTGCGISSRQAEDLLLGHGLRTSRFEEATFAGNALQQVESSLAEQIGCRADDVLVCASGMNAFYAGFRAVQELQQSRGRTAWLQLGWLYLDSGCVLQEFLGEAETLDCHYDVLDLDPVLARIREYGDRLAAVVVECPSNPLIRVCELGRIAAAVREQGGVMVVDPTIASMYNVDVLRYADLLVTSLTKYAAIEGDVMLGALALNPQSRCYGDLLLRVSAFYVPPYQRDLARLAHEMGTAPAVIQKMNANAARLCAFLRGHPAVLRIYCASCSEHVAAIAKRDGPGGVVITIELAGNMERFYDAIQVMKGPSFGTRFTLICPFMYLAHYDLVTTASGRAHLAAAGIDPELIRISVGAEDYADIEAVFAAALRESMEPITSA